MKINWPGVGNAIWGVAAVIIGGISINYIYDNYLNQRIVPDVRNQSLKEAKGVIAPLGLDIQVNSIPGGTQDLVSDQTPKPGVKVPAKTKIDLYVQQGSMKILVPPQDRTKEGYLSEKQFDIAVGTKISVNLEKDLSLQTLTSLSEITGQLESPIQVGNSVIAPKGSKVRLDVFYDKTELFPIVNLSIREIRQIDDRTLYPHTNKLERTNGSEIVELAVNVFFLWVIVFIFIGLFFWLAGIFTIFWITPEPLVFSIFSGVLIGIFSFFGVLFSAHNSFTIETKEVLHFEIREPTHGNLVIKP